jgi:phytoene dehydrogenase-like protein
MSPATNHDVVVIGAGVNGLTSAAYLAKAGRRVLVLERRASIGGLAAPDTFAPEFRTDALGGEAGYVSATLVRDLGLTGLDWIEPDAAVTTARANGGWLTLWRDVARTVPVLRQHSARDADAWLAFTARMSKFAAFLEHLYTTPPPNLPGGHATDLVPLAGLGRKLRGLGRTDMIELLRVLPMSIAELLDDTFEHDTLKAAIAPAGVRNIFQGPFSGGTAFVLLHHHVGERAGVFLGRRRLRGGAATLVNALAMAARRHGAEVRTGAEVASIVSRSGRVSGVVLDNGEEIASAAVVSSADPRTTFLQLADPVELSPEFTRAVDNIRYRGATALVDIALDAAPRFTDFEGAALSGAVSLTSTVEQLERAYDDAKHGAVSRAPHVLVTIPSLTDPSLCPPGKHVLHARVQYAPYRLREGSWDDARRQELGDAVVNVIADRAPGLRDLILHRRVRTPVDLEREYGIAEGDLAHGELALDQILFMRPVPQCAHYRTPIRGLYVCGSGSHPGGGIAGAAGRLAAAAIEKDTRRPARV